LKKQGHEWKANGNHLKPKPRQHILCNRKPTSANIQHYFDGFTAHFINKKKKEDNDGSANKLVHK